MKILKVSYVDGEALFVIEGFPSRTFCVNLAGKATTTEVTDKLKTMLPQPDNAEQTFNDLNLKHLEGTDI